MSRGTLRPGRTWLVGVGRRGKVAVCHISAVRILYRLKFGRKADSDRLHVRVKFKENQMRQKKVFIALQFFALKTAESKICRGQPYLGRPHIIFSEIRYEGGRRPRPGAYQI